MPIRSRQGRQARDLIETDEVEGAANRGRYGVAWSFLLRLGRCPRRIGAASQNRSPRLASGGRFFSCSRFGTWPPPSLGAAFSFRHVTAAALGPRLAIHTVQAAVKCRNERI